MKILTNKIEYNSELSTVNDLVNNDFCIGCGVCSGICNVNALEMKISDLGFPKPMLDENSCVNCGMCVKVCPFLNQTSNESQIANELFGNNDNIRFDNELGYFRKNFVGFINSTERLNSASGGFATYYLIELLNRKMVECVISVLPVNNSNLFEFKICNNVNDVAKSSGSKYFPLEISKVLKTINQENGTVALIGLPCLIKGIRLAMNKNSKLKSKIKYMAGLTCGKMKSRYFTDFLVRKVGFKNDSGNNIYFRKKKEGTVSTNFHFEVNTKKAQENNNTLPFKGVYGEYFGSGRFSSLACKCCDDVFAETADIVFMDAWLPQYTDWKGTSIVAIRNPDLIPIFEEGDLKNDITAHEISAAEIIRSQKGAISQKKEKLANQIWLWNKRKQVFPTKRVNPKRPSYKTYFKILLDEYYTEKSYIAWHKQNQMSNKELTLFFKEMKSEFVKLYLLRFLFAIAKRLNI